MILTHSCRIPKHTKRHVTRMFFVTRMSRKTCYIDAIRAAEMKYCGLPADIVKNDKNTGGPIDEDPWEERASVLSCTVRSGKKTRGCLGGHMFVGGMLKETGGPPRAGRLLSSGQPRSLSFLASSLRPLLHDDDDVAFPIPSRTTRSLIAFKHASFPIRLTIISLHLATSN